jgi:hypothetical protein
MIEYTKNPAETRGLGELGLESFWEQTMQSGGGWILEVDISTVRS